jgi:hypothetical protein
MMMDPVLNFLIWLIAITAILGLIALTVHLKEQVIPNWRFKRLYGYNSERDFTLREGLQRMVVEPYLANLAKTLDDVFKRETVVLNALKKSETQINTYEELHDSLLNIRENIKIAEKEFHDAVDIANKTGLEMSHNHKDYLK